MLCDFTADTNDNGLAIQVRSRELVVAIIVLFLMVMGVVPWSFGCCGSTFDFPNDVTLADRLARCDKKIPALVGRTRIRKF